MASIESEEELIRRFLAPLAHGVPEALDLLDDCALLSPKPGTDLVLTTDAVAEGVHFFADDAPEDIGWKALAVNVSDLAGKGAEPLAYLMALSFPSTPDALWLQRFADGLAHAQERFGLKLVGGDTDRRPGPTTITISAIGTVPAGKMVRRTTARPGDLIFVSGTLGDAALGLRLSRNLDLARVWHLDDDSRDHLLKRYLRPEPRLALRAALRSCASAAMDISDGLAKDLGRMCKASGCGAEVDAGKLPLSEAARFAMTSDPDCLHSVVGGGDDYEVLAAVPPARGAEFVRLAAQANVPIAEIGTVSRGTAVTFFGFHGIPIQIKHAGWDHFEQLSDTSAR